jgi:hypothetical protein
MNLKKEDRLLLNCLRAGDDPSRICGPDSLTDSDWNGIIRHSLRHYVAPLLYHRLKGSSPAFRVPNHVMSILHDIYLRNTGKNLRLYHKLSKALKILKHEGIPVIILKGAHLAKYVYGTIGERTFNDLDLLVKEEDLSRCQKILIEAGYYPYCRHLPLDIHWDFDLTPANLRVNIEDVWKRARPAVIAGVEVLVLSPEDLLLHLCLHLAVKQLFRSVGLRTFCDIRETIRHHYSQIQWKKLTDYATQWGAGNSVYLTLLFARDFLDARVPSDTLEALKPDNLDPHIEAWAIEQIFHCTGDLLCLSPYFWQLWQPGSLREKVNHFFNLIFPPPEFITQEYPASYGSPQNYLYYLNRMRNHLPRYIHAIWRMLIRDKKMLTLAKHQNRNIAMREWLSSEQQSS